MKIEIRTRLLTLAAGIVIALAEIALAGIWDFAQSLTSIDSVEVCCKAAEMVARRVSQGQE